MYSKALVGKRNREQFLFSMNFQVNAHGGGGNEFVQKTLRHGTGAFIKL